MISVLHSGGNIITLQGDCFSTNGFSTILLWDSPDKWIVYLGLRGHHSLLKSRVIKNKRAVERFIKKNIFGDEKIHHSVFLEMEEMDKRMTEIYSFSPAQ